MKLPNFNLLLALPLVALTGHAQAETTQHATIAEQNLALEAATAGKGYGPQSPRDIDAVAGRNSQAFDLAPPATQMNLCNIHLHENAEHKGGEFTTYAGDGDLEGNGTGFKYNGTLTKAELAPFDRPVGASKHGDLQPGDTIEVHFVYSTAQVDPGETLKACLNEATANPQLRVEAQVMVLVNDDKAADFGQIAKLEKEGAYWQVPNLPSDTGTPVVYTGSTTGPDYNEKGSPFEVTWSVRPKVEKVSIASLDAWLKDNPFAEDHAHGVRNLVTEPDLLSTITH